MNERQTLGHYPRSSWMVWLQRLHAVVTGIYGFALFAGGVLLAINGGSLYYLIAGAVSIAAAVFTWRRQLLGAWFYGTMLVGTLAWSIAEVGADTWGLIARLVAPAVLGLPFLVTAWSGRSFKGAQAFVAVSVIAVAAGCGVHAMAPGAPIDPLWERGQAKAPDTLAQPLTPDAGGDWHYYGNDQGGSRFSPLSQITPANVANLKVAWEADLGPAAQSSSAGMEVTPIKVGDSLYACSGYNVVVALDAKTGHERWRFDMSGDTPPSGKPCRGVSYYKVPEGTPGDTGICSERILATSQKPELFALDAATGKACPNFGEGGRVDLHKGMGKVPFGYNYVSSAPQIIRGKAVFGGAVMDGQYWGEPSGVIRAFDAVTGALAWAYDAGRPDDPNEPVGDETYTHSTPNSWAPISADEKLGLVYLPTGNATPDYYGAQRRPFDDEISSSVLALDADTGRLRWRFQTTHHDIWDYDVASQPTLVDVPTANGPRPALIQPTKRGEIFVLDRETGEPIKTVTEKATPQNDPMPGERLSPTQPFSTGMPSFRGATLRESDMWGMTPVDQMVCRILFKESHYEGTLTPISLDRPTIIDPGYGGGVNWGGVSVDADRGIMMVNWVRTPNRIKMFTRAEGDKQGIELFDGKSQGKGMNPMKNTPFAAIVGPFLSPLGIPCNSPPWGTLTAVDLSSGKAIWSQPLGTGRDSGPLGIRSHLPLTMGVPNIGGSVATRSGLVFIGAAADGMLRAFDIRTGERRWESRLPGGGQATPMTYQTSDGRQYVVISAGGKLSMKARQSTKLVAYALPE